MTEINDPEESFDEDSFVFTENEKGEVVGGGYKIKSFFLQEGISPMTTYNDSSLTGGNKTTGEKVSSPFENLAVPAGLFYINMRVPKNINNTSEEHYKNHKMASDEMIDKLYSLIEVDKKRNRKTKKNKHILDTHKIQTKMKKKTRKHK